MARARTLSAGVVLLSKNGWAVLDATRSSSLLLLRGTNGSKCAMGAYGTQQERQHYRSQAVEGWLFVAFDVSRVVNTTTAAVTLHLCCRTPSRTAAEWPTLPYVGAYNAESTISFVAIVFLRALNRRCFLVNNGEPEGHP